MPRPQKLGWQVQQGRKRSQNQQYHSNTNPSWLKQGSGQFPQKSGAETDFIKAETRAVEEESKEWTGRKHS